MQTLTAVSLMVTTSGDKPSAGEKGTRLMSVSLYLSQAASQRESERPTADLDDAGGTVLTGEDLFRPGLQIAVPTGNG
jgi:hypothetical protein